MKKMFFLAAGLLLMASMAHAQATATSPATLTLTVSNEATISIDASTPLMTGTTAFDDYTGTTNYHYQVRTTQSTGSGTISFKVTTDFSNGTGGAPSVANPPNAADKLTVTSCTATVGTPCSTVLTASTISSQTAVTFGPNAHAGTHGPVATNGVTGAVVWDFTNDPTYPTGPYTAVATFTISAT